MTNLMALLNPSRAAAGAYVEEAKLLELLDDVSPEYAAAATRYFGEEQGQAWIAQLHGQPMARVAIRPNWVGILDFQTRFPAP
jgi:hypothetical protein